MRFVSQSEEHTKKIAEKIFDCFLQDKKVVLLSGDFGVGKTVFVKGLARALEISELEVTSPSFTLLREYKTPTRTLIHCDLYRITRSADLESLDLARYYNKEKSLLVIEWAQHIKDWDFDDYLRVEIQTGDNEERIILVDF